MDILTKVGAFLDGKKAYIVSILVGGIGLYMALNPAFVIPEWVWALLGAAGLGAVRSAIGNK